MPRRPKALDLMTRRDDYRRVFTTPEGERVLRHILGRNHVLSDPYVPGDAVATARNLGMQRAALSIVGIMRMSDEQITAIMQEKDPYGGN